MTSLIPLSALSQSEVNDEVLESLDDDLNVGGDIFTDFQESLESSQIYEEERFYRYGRFFSVNFGLGATTFTGNRGIAYHDKQPTFALSTNYFVDFRHSFTLGVEYSKHVMFIDTVTKKYTDTAPGAIEVNLIRPFFGYRYYFDTSDLSSPFTYSNPYFTARLEYWYQTNKFVESAADSTSEETQRGGGIGFGLGFGFEFPIEFKKSYVGVEGLVHQVNFFDKYTSDYQVSPNGDSEYGITDLTGLAYSLVVSLNQTW
ncbi:MAG: hypothetical protein H6620_09640 [Halobacteriovoraceae bacterium]|nr:hypothetical protein [Halobacteriovoraceae bacterium]